MGAGGVSHSWATEHQGSFTHMWRTDAGPDLQPGPGITDWEFTPDVVHAPQEAPGVDSNNAHYITMGAMLSPHPEFIGSLTHHRYCVEGEEGPAACAPVWDGIEGLPGGEEDEGPDRDLADMDELDMAGCHSFGAARLSVLIDARRGAESCEIDDGDPQPCIPFYRPISLGCAFLKIVVEDSEGGDR